MDAKYWAEEYNKAGPPKKIDIMQMMIIELLDMPDKPIYHVESVIGWFVQDCLLVAFVLVIFSVDLSV